MLTQWLRLAVFVSTTAWPCFLMFRVDARRHNKDLAIRGPRTGSICFNYCWAEFVSLHVQHWQVPIHRNTMIMHCFTNGLSPGYVFTHIAYVSEMLVEAFRVL